jgi:hypothetical protein
MQIDCVVTQEKHSDDCQPAMYFAANCNIEFTMTFKTLKLNAVTAL